MLAGRLYIRVVASFAGSNVSKLASSKLFGGRPVSAYSPLWQTEAQGHLETRACDALCHSGCLRPHIALPQRPIRGDATLC